VIKLVDEIIEMAADGKKPLADALRKCLVLAFELKNERLKEWIEKELNGYTNKDEVPPDLLPNLPSFIRRVCSSFAPPWGVLRTRLV
jgi:hypothetical protein